MKGSDSASFKHPTAGLLVSYPYSLKVNQVYLDTHRYPYIRGSPRPLLGISTAKPDLMHGTHQQHFLQTIIHFLSGHTESHFAPQRMQQHRLPVYSKVLPKTTKFTVPPLRLNIVTEPDHYPVPNNTDITNGLHGASIFSKLDLLMVTFKYH